MSFRNPALEKSRKPRMLSLFSGIGGLDLGFAQAGFMPIGAYDVWKTAIEVYQENVSSDAYVLDLSKNEVTANLQPDVVVAGSPCQGFSAIGKRRIGDPRNSLFVRAAEMAVGLNPQAIVLENVRGIVLGEHKAYYDRAVAALQRAKFYVHHIELGAQNVGLPQRRRRVFLVAMKSQRTVDLEISSCQTVVGETIVGSDLQSHHEPVVLSPRTRDFEIAKAIGPGQKLCDVRGGYSAIPSWEIPQVFGHTTNAEREILLMTMRLRRRLRRRRNGDADPILRSDLAHHVGGNVNRHIDSLISKQYMIAQGGYIDLKRRFNGKYRRLESEGISNAVDTRFGDPRYFLHPTEARGLSVREAARLQGFPDSLSLRGSTSDQFKMIGNAVPVPMANAIAKAVRRTLKT